MTRLVVTGAVVLVATGGLFWAGARCARLRASIAHQFEAAGREWRCR